MRSKISKIYILVFFILLFSVGCSQKEEVKETEESSIKLVGGKDWGISNPYLQDPRGPGTGKAKLIFDSLLDMDEEGIIDWLAKDWEVDGDKYTFEIYSDAKFHDGKELTSDDIGFTIDYYKVNPPINNTLGSGENFIIKEYKILDKYKIEIEVKESGANTLVQLGSFPIIPKHIWEKVDDPYIYFEEDGLIGSGPYTWGEYDPASGTYEFIANKDYYGRQALVDKVLFLPISDPILGFEKGDVDLVTLPIDLIDKYEKDSQFGVINKENDFGYKMLINMDRFEYFKDLEYRINLYQAIDRNEILEKIFRGLGDIGSAGYVPRNNKFYNEDVIKYEYDLSRSKEFFTDKNIELNILVSDSDLDIKIAELIKNNLEDVGMSITVTSLDGKSRDEKIFSEEYDLAIVGNGGWSRTPDYLRTLYSDKSKFSVKNPHGMGPIGYSNGKITDLAERQIFEIDESKRKELIEELQYEISKEIPILVIGNKSEKVVYRKDDINNWTKTYDYQQIEQNRMSFVKDR